MIAVTGGAGFIGSALVWKLNQEGLTDILVVDQKAEASPKWKNLSKRSFSAYLESDAFLSRLEKGEWNGKIEAIFHMGACSDTTERDVAYLEENNTRYSERVSAWAVQHNAYLAYASSAATYGAGELGYSDDDALTPRLKALNPYGRSKLAFDIRVLEKGWDKKITGFRFFNVYGPNEYHKGDMRSLAHKGFHQIGETGKLRLFKSYRLEYPDGGQMRDFVYVKDVVDTLWWFYRKPHVKGIYNVGSGRAESWNALAKALFDATAKPWNVEYFDMPDSIRNQYQYFTEADLNKLRETGCPVRFRNLSEGVRDYVGNYLAGKDSYF